jgi:serine/threonine-protein kinase ULK/ATG1
VQHLKDNDHHVCRIPPGTSADLTDLLMGLLRRDARDRIDFDTFFNHAFIKVAAASPPPPPPPPPPPSHPISVPTPGAAALEEVKAVSSFPESGLKLFAPKNSAPNLMALGARHTPPMALVSRTPPIPGILPPSPVTTGKIRRRSGLTVFLKCYTTF